jgi:Flp pilus assembly protein TadG
MRFASTRFAATRGTMMRLRTDDWGLIGKILLIWLVILGLIVVALIDGGSIVLARLRTNDLARDAAFAAEERFSETGKRRQAVRAAHATIAESDEDARLVELEVSGRGDVTVVVTDRAGTLLVGRFGFFEHMTTAIASDTAP